MTINKDGISINSDEDKRRKKEEGRRKKARTHTDLLILIFI